MTEKAVEVGGEGLPERKHGGGFQGFIYQF